MRAGAHPSSCAALALLRGISLATLNSAPLRPYNHETPWIVCLRRLVGVWVSLREAAPV